MKEEIDSFIATHLEALCDDYIHWSNTGVLDDGAMRVLADRIQSYYPMDTTIALIDATKWLGDFLIRKQHVNFILGDD